VSFHDGAIHAARITEVIRVDDELLQRSPSPGALWAVMLHYSAEPQACAGGQNDDGGRASN
jgi:hypothetical protein